MEQTEYHRPFQSLLISHVATALEEVRAGGSSQGILLIGGSGTGKTHAFDLIAGSFERKLLDGQMLTPCVRIEMPLNPTPKNIVIAALKPLGGVYTSGGHSTPETQLRDAFDCHQVKVVLLEEFHNALLSGTTAVRNQVLKFVK
ncbi:TniB family NTP-binding protein, partial [Paucibacter sp. TC2R-5]|uniref:TniB family NTP-binding protein n=1 Tax=Paucibacter sp. TC2R-5 TaxID=2893555 RepID=UPI0021E3E70B